MQAQKGFTLIELIVVIVILGILASVAAPKFLDLSSDAKTAALNSTKGAIKSAMLMAFAKHRAAGLTTSAGGDSQYITTCATLKHYLEGGDFPSGLVTSCTDTGTGGTIDWADSATDSTFTSETNTVAAALS